MHRGGEGGRNIEHKGEEPCTEVEREGGILNTKGRNHAQRMGESRGILNTKLRNHAQRWGGRKEY